MLQGTHRRKLSRTDVQRHGSVKGLRGVELRDDMTMPQQPPDIVLLVAEWQLRAILRAQLIEEGFEVVGTDTWVMMRRHLRPGSKPRLAIVDLKDLQNPRETLNDLRVLMDPNRVVVLTAIGTVPAADIEYLGFHWLSRPIIVRNIIQTVIEAISPRRC
jgi:hypothetical protein